MMGGLFNGRMVINICHVPSGSCMYLMHFKAFSHLLHTYLMYCINTRISDNSVRGLTELLKLGPRGTASSYLASNIG